MQRTAENIRVSGCKKNMKDVFLEYRGDEMKDRKEISSMSVGDLREVLVQSTTPKFWSVNKEFRFCTATMKHRGGKKGRIPEDAMFVAFYRTEPVSAITHLAKVEAVELNVPSEEIYRGTSLEEEGEEWGAIDKVYRLGKIVELQRKIPKGKGGPVRDFRYTTMTRLLSAKTIADL
jgi:hypothetical protein